MVLLPEPAYKPSWPFTCGHVQTLYPTILRRTPQTSPVRVRIETDDGDFFDIDFHRAINKNRGRLAVVSHGLEGNSRKKYMLGMARALTGRGWDVVCLNFRGCSGEMNRLPRLYHSGVTDDLHTAICQYLATGRYTKVTLIGFSMGGNQTLKYLGEKPEKVPHQVKCAVVFSVPVQLADSSRLMEHPSNRVYMEYFMYGLHQKIRKKAEMFPEMYDTEGLAKMKSFFPFDDKYTGPVHGFKNAADYYHRCSAKQFISRIQTQTLLVQAKDDPFLPKSCYPVEEAAASQHVHLEIPPYGGHVGFVNENRGEPYWMESRACRFLEELLKDGREKNLKTSPPFSQLDI